MLHLLHRFILRIFAKWQDATKNAAYKARSRSNHALGRFFK